MPDELSVSQPAVEPPVEGNTQQGPPADIDALHAEIVALRDLVRERLTYDRVKEEAFDRLYAEVEEVRQERAFQQLRPFLIDLLLLYDRIELSRQRLVEQAGRPSEVGQLLQSLSEEVLEILARRDVEMLVVVSTTFDRTLQQAIKLQPSERIEEHQQVLRVVRRGFRYRQRILRCEEVIVGVYRAGE